MNYTTVAIIGMGPRGLSILERLITLYDHYPYPGEIRLLLIDSNDMGMGVHSTCQPNHLLVNAVACQITLFGDETVTEGGPVRQGPNFHQWAIQQGYRNIKGTFVRTTHVGRVIEEDDYLPRCLLGEYLDWAYRTFTQELPPGMRILSVQTNSRGKPRSYLLIFNVFTLIYLSFIIRFL